MILTAWEAFAARMAELRDLAGAITVLTWDQETMMPPRGVAARSEHLATLQCLVHERLAAPELAEAIEELATNAGLDEARAAMVRAVRLERERAVRIPADLVRELARTQSRAVEVWKDARARSDFALLKPHLERLLAIRREMASAWLPLIDGSAELYDALLEGHEEGMRVARLAPVFDRLVAWLVPLADRLASAPRPEDAFLRRRFDPERQWRFSLELLEAMGFDLGAGRQDRSAHPFTLGIDPGDVRVTTRIFEELPLSAIFSTLHEAGHGLYEQGLPAEHRRTAICAAPSMGLHESQSRLWENLVGRSLPFWQAFLPRLAAHFPAELAGVTPEAMVVAVNRVERSPIRVEADEVTYNLHIALRFGLELSLVRGELAVADVPAAWAERSAHILGLRPRNDAEGVLQDIHWAWGEIGYFPTYTIGNLYAATLFAAARRDLPDLDDEIRRGELLPLRDWLRDEVHRLGRVLPAEEIVRRAAGRGLGDEDFRAYLESKYAIA